MRTAKAPSPGTVALADDHPVVIHGMRQLLMGSRFRIIWHASNRDDCVRMCREQPPEVLILDLRLGPDLAPDVFRELSGLRSATKTVILTGHQDEELLQRCLHAGVSGIVLKDTHDLEMVDVLERVLREETVLDHRLESTLGAKVREPDAEDTGLTQREHEVLILLARGLTSKQIGLELHLSVNTVRSYVQTLLLKLEAHTRIEAVAVARKLRLI